MTVARTAGALIGTSESSGVTVANNASTTSSETDFLANNTSEGWIRLYLAFTSTVTAGTLDESFWSSRVAGTAATATPPIIASVAPINGSQIFGPEVIGIFRIGRYATFKVANNATGASATNVFLGYELIQES